MKGPMADYYTHFSFILTLKDAAQKAYALGLAHIASSTRFEETQLPATFPEPLKEVLEDWAFEVEGVEDGLWFYSESGGIDAVSCFIQHLLQKYDNFPYLSFEWSHDCSKPRTDAYGGGAAYVTAKEIKSVSTSEWLSNLISVQKT
jgi:hypothetical protein